MSHIKRLLLIFFSRDFELSWEGGWKIWCWLLRDDEDEDNIKI